MRPVVRGALFGSLILSPVVAAPAIVPMMTDSTKEAAVFGMLAFVPAMVWLGWMARSTDAVLDDLSRRLDALFEALGEDR